MMVNAIATRYRPAPFSNDLSQTIHPHALPHTKGTLVRSRVPPTPGVEEATPTQTRVAAALVTAHAFLSCTEPKPMVYTEKSAFERNEGGSGLSNEK